MDTHLIHLGLRLLQATVAGEVGRLLGGSSLCWGSSSCRGRPKANNSSVIPEKEKQKKKPEKPIHVPFPLRQIDGLCIDLVSFFFFYQTLQSEAPRQTVSFIDRDKRCVKYIFKWRSDGRTSPLYTVVYLFFKSRQMPFVTKSTVSFAKVLLIHGVSLCCDLLGP